ncbi:MAG: hypothetical protein AAGJ83_01015 [Planctomycetota bacterium]
MSRLVALLIVPLLAVGNSVGHTHGVSHSVDSHAVRPHFHCGHRVGQQSGHHVHVEEGDIRHPRSSGDDAPVGHDADAIYLPDGAFFFARPGGIRVAADCTSFAVLFFSSSVVQRPWENGVIELPARDHGPPLFLLHAALRL